MASMLGKRLKYLRHGFSMSKLLKNMTNGIYIWEMTYICDKWLKYLRNN